MAAESDDALRTLAAALGDEDTPIAPHVREPTGDPIHPPGKRAPVVEAVREGYLLHYEEPRLLAGHDPDLALLAGDYLYALGIERLAASGDIAAILVLADLISDCAQLHTEGRGDEAPAVWERAVEEMSG